MEDIKDVLIVNPAKSDFGVIADNDNFRDVALVTSDGETLLTNKSILCAKSKTVSDLFLAGDSSVIILDGYLQGDLRILLELLYKGETLVKENQVATLLSLVEEFQVIDPLKELTQSIANRQYFFTTNKVLDEKHEFGIKVEFLQQEQNVN